MRWYTIILLIGFSYITKAQSRADSLRSVGDMEGALKEFHRIYIQDSKNTFNIYNYACALSQSRQADSSFKYLYIQMAIDLQNLSSALTDPEFIFLRTKPAWKIFEDSLVNMICRKGYLKVSDLDLARRLWKMRAYDQAYYSDIDIASKKLGNKSTVVLALWDLKDSINLKNVKLLEEIINKNGWPKESEVGSRAASAAFLIIQHSEIEHQKKYLPAIEALCKQKEASWQSYALMYDRVLVSEKKPQRYGSQLRYIEETKVYELYPLENEAKVEEWLKEVKEVGLEPLNEYLKFWNIKFEPKSEKK